MLGELADQSFGELWYGVVEACWFYRRTAGYVEANPLACGWLVADKCLAA